MGARSKEQLEMIWPERLVAARAAARALRGVARAPAGYRLRVYEPGDESSFASLMERAGFGEWDNQKVQGVIAAAIPRGLFFVVEERSGKIVSTAGGYHRPAPRHPFAGELGWVATEPAHRGRGLAGVASAAAVRRLIAAGYERIYLKTDDPRLAAVKLYLKMGFVPYLFSEDMPARWQALFETLGYRYTPELWPGPTDRTNAPAARASGRSAVSQNSRRK